MSPLPSQIRWKNADHTQNVAQVTTAKAVEAEDDVETANWLDSLFTQPAPATEYSWLNAMGEQWSQAGDTGAVNGEESWESMLQTIPNDPRLMDALQTQPVTIQGKPGEDQALELYYYRFVSVPCGPLMLYDADTPSRDPLRSTLASIESISG